MKALNEEKVESRADRATDVAMVAIVVVGLTGLVTAQADVPLQFDNKGFSSFAPPPLAAIIYSFLGLFMRFVAVGSSHPWVRWVGRLLVFFLLAFEIVAVAWAS